ncbi:MAG: hypothetical protein ACLQVI_08790 [Polyangiaceae bacterium]
MESRSRLRSRASRSLALACVVLWPRVAFGQTPASVAHDQGIAFGGWVGGGTSSVVTAGPTGTFGVAATVLYYDRWFELGLVFTFQSLVSYVGVTSEAPGGLVGVKVDPTPWLRFEVLAEGAGYIVSGVGDQTAMPYFGGRVCSSFLFGSARRSLLGLWVSGGDVVDQTTTGPVGGGPMWSLGLRIGGDAVQW